MSLLAMSLEASERKGCMRRGEVGGFTMSINGPALKAVCFHSGNTLRVDFNTKHSITNQPFIPGSMMTFGIINPFFTETFNYMYSTINPLTKAEQTCF